MVEGETLSIAMARITLLLAVACLSGCAGLQSIDEPYSAVPLPTLESHPIPDRPVYSLEELEKEPSGLAYSIQFKGESSPELQRLVSQRLYGWLRGVRLKGNQLPLFKLAPEEKPPEGYPYRLQVVIEPDQGQHKLQATLSHSPSGRKYPLFERLFSMGEQKAESSDLALFHSLAAFLSQQSGPYISFPSQTGNELSDWLQSMGTGRVRILSSQQADVRISDRNGKEIKSGSTPLDANLASGAYQFYIKRKGMPPVSRSLIVRPASKEVLLLTWPDDESASSLSVFTSPEELQVAADGTVAGDSPVAFPSVMPGDIEMEIARREEDSNEAYILRQNTVAAGDGQDLTRFYPFEYYMDFLRAEKIGSLWTSNQPLKSVERDLNGVRIKTVRSADGPPAGLLSQPLEAMNQRIRITLDPGASWQFGLSTGPGGDRPYLKLEQDRMYFTPPASNDEVSSAVYARPAAAEGQLDVIELIYIEESANLRIALNGRKLYDGPFQNTGYFRVYLASQGNDLPVREVEIQGGPYMGSPALTSVSSFFWNLGRSLGMNSRLQPVPEGAQ